MTLRNTRDTFGAIAKGFHWLVALMVVALIGVGLYMTSLDPGPALFKTYALHKSVGITVLVLAVLRVLWRLYNPPPSGLSTHKPWEKKLAGLTHAFLYISLFLMPISGWIMSSAKDFSVSVFGLFTLPDLVAPNESLAENMVTLHTLWAYGLIGLILLHVAGALKHHVVDRDATLRRMLPLVTMMILLWPMTARADDVAAWSVVKDKSTLSFEATQMGAPFDGKFGDFDGTILFDAANLPASKADITIAVDSVDATSADRNKYLPMADWFATAQFPTARFVTKKIEKGLDATQYVAHGDLTIRDTTLPIILPFTLRMEKDATGADMAVMTGETTLNRLDYGVGQGQWKDTKSVGAEVRVRVSLTATRK